MVAVFVFLSLFVFIAETHPAFQLPFNATNETSSGMSEHHERQPWPGLETLDYVCVAFFTFDILIRLCVTPQKVTFLLSPITVIEIVAVIPYYIDFVSHFIHARYGHKPNKYLDVIHVFRIFGILRVFKILRHYSGLQVLIYTLRTSIKDLLLMLTFIGIATLFFSTLIYFSDDRAKFSSIPASFWWSIITMTTVGYGDFYPTRPWGYLVGSACALIGVLVVAFTVPILVNSFMLFYSHSQSILNEDREERLSRYHGRGYVDQPPKILRELQLKHLVPSFDAGRTRSNGDVASKNSANEGDESLMMEDCPRVQIDMEACGSEDAVSPRTSQESVLDVPRLGEHRSSLDPHLLSV